jgi:hypothetical protein
MTGKGLVNSSTIKNSQIIGHVQGWMAGIPTRAKESQKAQQRVAKAMQGIYNKPLLRLLYASMSPLVTHLKILPMIKKCSSIQLCILSRVIRYRGEVTGLLTEDENVVDPRSLPNKDICAHKDCKKSGNLENPIDIQKGFPRWYSRSRLLLGA